MAWVGRGFSLQINIKCCIHESCVDQKGRGGVALWHPVPTSDDMKLISKLVPELDFHRPGSGAVEDLHCGGTVAANMTWA